MEFKLFSEFWYICGVAEDAYVRTSPQKGYEFDLDSASLGWLEQIQPLIRDLINKDIIIRPHTNRLHYRLRFFHKELVTKILEVKNNPELVRLIKPEFQQQWIAGFFDAEGSATTTGTNQPMLSIYSSENIKICILQELLNQFSIHSGVYLPNDRNVYQLYITGHDNIRDFACLIPLRHPDKCARIRSFFSP